MIIDKVQVSIKNCKYGTIEVTSILYIFINLYNMKKMKKI